MFLLFSLIFYVFQAYIYIVRVSKMEEINIACVSYIHRCHIVKSLTIVELP